LRQEVAGDDLSSAPEPKNWSLKEMPSDDAWLSDRVSERIKHMVTWQLVAELMRRHRPRVDLRVFELHPGGGMGDSLFLFKNGRNGLEELNDLRGFRRVGEDRPHRDLDDGGAYVWPWLRAEDPKVIVDAVEELCGLPRQRGHLPVADRTTRVVRLMAGLLTLACGQRMNLQWRSALLDTSGMVEGGVRPTFKALEHIASALDGERNLARYQRFWMLVPGPEPHGWKPAPVHAVADLKGKLWFGPGCKESYDVGSASHHVDRLTTVAKSALPWRG